MSGNQDEIIRRLIIDVEALKAEQKRQASLVPLYSILSTNLPAQLTADVNNYDPGNYDLLFMFSNASRTITGFSGGVAGRMLWINTYGSQNIVLAHNSASSLAANRISTHTAANITLTPRQAAVLVYTGSIWNLLMNT